MNAGVDGVSRWKAQMKSSRRWHPVLTWALAWGLTGLGLLIADVMSTPRRGPLWVGLLFGLVGWGLAGGITFPFDRRRTGIVVWAGAYGLAFWLGGVWAGRASSAGFVGGLFGWAAGGGLGALVTALLVNRARRLLRSVTFAAVWGVAFFVSGLLGLVVGVTLGQLSDSLFGGSLGYVTFILFWCVGCALGGSLAAGLGFAAWRALFGSRPVV